MFIPLTKLERDILLHRLEADGAIAEVLREDNGYHEDDTLAVCESLRRDLSSRGLNTTDAEAINASLTHAVIVECVEGSTYCGGLYQTASNAKYRVACRAAESLAAKIGNAIGRRVGAKLY